MFALGVAFAIVIFDAEARCILGDVAGGDTGLGLLKRSMGFGNVNDSDFFANQKLQHLAD